MRIIHIYVEGKGDMNFICQFLKKHFEVVFPTAEKDLKICGTHANYSVDLLTCSRGNGNGGINSQILTSLLEQAKINAQAGIESIILIDADTPAHADPKGGFPFRQQFLSEKAADNAIKYFILPDHQSDGNLEDLLDGLISEKGEKFYACLTNYTNCLSSIITENIPKGYANISDFKKAKLEWYSFIMLGNKKSDRDYTENDIWNLNAERLNPLKQFFYEILKDMPEKVGTS